MKKKSKRIWSMVLGSAVLLTMMLIFAGAAETEPTTSGKCGENVTWIFSSDTGTLTISGTGEMNNYSSLMQNSAPWKELREEIKRVVIQDGVTTVGGGSFISCINLETVDIATSVQSIERRAFESCTSIMQIDLPQSIHSIGSSVFEGCTGLSSITLPNDLSKIESYTFAGCSDLQQVAFPEKLEEIGDSSFSDCIQLENVTIPDNTNRIGEFAFKNCTSIESIIIPTNISNLAQYAFSGCTNIKSLTIPASIDHGYGGAFESCSAVTYIKFTGDGPMGTFVPLSTPWYQSSAEGNQITIVIENGVTSISENAFQNCAGLENISIPQSVTQIGSGAFENCTGLQNIILPNNLRQIEDKTFSGCTNLNNIKIPSSVSGINTSAFSNCSNIKNITIPDGVISIGDNVFENCGKLTDVIIPDSVTTIGNGVFKNCSSLTNVTISDSITNISEDTFSECDSITSVTIPDGVTRIGSSAFYSCDNLKEVTMPNSVTGIGDSAFWDCDSLTRITIPNSVTDIGNSAFADCDSLTEIMIPDSVTDIGHYAFNYCSNLTDVYYSGTEADWAAISIGTSNSALNSATIHYNSTGPDDPGSGETDSSIICMINTLTGYDENTKQVTFGGDPTPYTYQITDETVLSEDINKLFGKTVLVRYKSGEYGAPDMLTHYVLSISPASVASGTLKNVTQNIISIGNKEYPLDIQNGSASLDILQNNLGNFAVCYFYNDAVVDVKFPKKQTGIFNTGTQSSITIDNKKYLAAFAEPAPYLSAIDLWFNQTVEYWIVDGIIYDIRLPDYETTIYKRLEKIQDNKVYFHDGSNYQIVDNGAIDDSLVGHWVVATLTTSAGGGTMLSDMRLFQPQISVEIEMVDDRNVRLKDNEYSYDGSDYVPSSKFEIGYEITIKSKVPGISDIDLVAMREDPSMTVTLENLEINPPDGFNSGWTGSGEIPDVPGTTVLPGQTKVGKGFVRPGMWYFVDKEDVSVTETIRMKLETSAGEYEDEVSFTIMNLNYEPPKTKEEALNSSETKELIEKAADELDKLDVGSGIMITDLSLVKYYLGIDDKNLTRLKKDLLTEVIMSSAPEDSLSDQITDDIMSKVFGEYKSPVSGAKYTVPLQYVFETPNYGMLTVQFTCNINSFTLSGSKYALYATVDYKILHQDKDSGDKDWPTNKKKGDFAQITFADVKAYTDAAYDVAKEAIKDAYDDVWGKQANQIADFLFDDVVKAILKASKTSFSDAMWKIITWPTENMSVACPVDIFIYDANGNLCGSIENNQVTKTSAEFGLSVNGDVKYVTGLRDDYKVLYKATDNGSMDIAITEYTGYESPLRAVTFKAVPLAQDGTYTQNIAGEVLAEVSSYKLISNTEEGDIIPDDKVILIGWTSDENDQEETPTPPSEPGGNSGGSGGSSSSTNRYTISVVDGINNGFIGVNPSQAEPGDIVTITIDPDAGYELDALIVTDSSGNQIAIEKETDTCYTFKMPRGRVSIDATFIAIEDESASQTFGEPFTDVSSRDWFYDAVEYVYENGMMQGTSSSLFEPNGVATRAMVVTILHRCERETRTYKSDFTDVASNMYYADAVAWAQANGIVNGTSATTFSPNDPITREQMATILYRYADFKDYDMTIGGMSLHKYTDADQISAFANDAMRWANENELITGDTAMSLNPQDNATRAEVAMILMRFCKSMVE